MSLHGNYSNLRIFLIVIATGSILERARFLESCSEAYAQINESNPCLPPEAFHAELKGSYNGDQLLKFPTSGISNLFDTYGKLPPISGDRYFPYGKVPLMVPERSSSLARSPPIYPDIAPSNHNPGPYYTQRPVQQYGTSLILKLGTRTRN